MFKRSLWQKYGRERLEIKRGNPVTGTSSFLFRISEFSLVVNSFFFDSSFLTSKSAQVIQFSATNFTYLVHFDAIDSRWFDWENSFYTYSTWHFTYSKTFLVSVTGDFDNNTTVQLYTFFVTLDDTICYCYSVSCFEARCCLPVANASSAILIKSIVAIIKLFYRYNATYQVSLLLTAIARKRCKVTNYLSDSQMFWRKWSAVSWYRMFLGLHQTNVAIDLYLYDWE